MEWVVFRLDRLLLALLTLFDEFPCFHDQLLLSIHQDNLRENLDIQNIILLFQVDLVILLIATAIDIRFLPLW